VLATHKQGAHTKQRTDLLQTVHLHPDAEGLGWASALSGCIDISIKHSCMSGVPRAAYLQEELLHIQLRVVSEGLQACGGGDRESRASEQRAEKGHEHGSSPGSAGLGARH